MQIGMDICILASLKFRAKHPSHIFLSRIARLGMCSRRRHADLRSAVAIEHWACLVYRLQRIQRLRRLWAALGGFLRTIKEAGRKA